MKLFNLAFQVRLETGKLIFFFLVWKKISHFNVLRKKSELKNYEKGSTQFRDPFFWLSLRTLAMVSELHCDTQKAFFNIYFSSLFPIEIPITTFKT